MKKDLSVEQQIPTPVVFDHAVLSYDQINQDSSNWLKRNFLKLSLGAFVAGTAAAIVTNPMDHLTHDVEQAAPCEADHRQG